MMTRGQERIRVSGQRKSADGDCNKDGLSFVADQPTGVLVVPTRVWSLTGQPRRKVRVLSVTVLMMPLVLLTQVVRRTDPAT